MKIFLLVGSLLTGIQAFSETSDTTVTSFEIRFKRKPSDETIGFNTTSFDRLKLYESVISQLRQKLSAEAFYSLHQPQVLLHFDEYLSGNSSHIDEISFGEERSLKGHQYNYFVKIHGHFNGSTLSPFHKRTFTLRICVFDAQGRLIAKGRARSALNDATNNGGDNTLSEDEFIELVSAAAGNVQLEI